MINAFFNGVIVMIDIDCMENIVKRRGWSKYKPNKATGLLTNLVEMFAVKWRAIVIYGLDHKRGTEETVLEIPLADPWELAEDLVSIAQRMEEENVTVTIVARSAPLIGKPARKRREAYQGFRSAVAAELRRLKRIGGGVVSIEGTIIYRSPRRPSECMDHGGPAREPSLDEEGVENAAGYSATYNAIRGSRQHSVDN